MRFHQHGPEVIRTDSISGRFGQIRKVAALGTRERPARGVEWKAEIRIAETGGLVRYAGIWPTRRAALRECEEILKAY